MHAITVGEIEWALPVGFLLISFIMAVFLIAPAVFWVGSLTPTLFLGLEGWGHIKVPAYTPESKSLWDFEFRQVGQGIYNLGNNCQRLKDRRALVTNCPVLTLQSLLLLTGAGATTANGQTRAHAKHAKHANPIWAYQGRSYGVGASVGLSNPSFSNLESTSPSTYSYNETWYNVKVNCTKNPNSRLSVMLQNASVPISTYYLTGYLPKEDDDSFESYPITSFHDDYDNLCAWAARSNTLGNYISIASGQGNYSYLNTVECRATFHPTLFSVSVNTSSQSITITPLPNTTVISPLDRTSHLPFNAIESLSLLSRISNTLYLSSIGDSLQSNVMNMASRLNATTITEQIITSAAVEYFAAILDDILVAYASSQLLIANTTTLTSVSSLSNGVKIGDHIYILLSLILNLLLCTFLLIETLRTRLWRNLPRFNYADIRHAIIASSAGGAEFATAVAAAKDAKAITVGVKESNFVDGMIALGLPSVHDTVLTPLHDAPRLDDGVLVLNTLPEENWRLSRFSGGWTVGGRGHPIGTAR